jgi:hypothetical protein
MAQPPASVINYLDRLGHYIQFPFLRFMNGFKEHLLEDCSICLGRDYTLCRSRIPTTTLGMRRKLGP